MKLKGIQGTGSGKLGSHVYASVAGEQIVRAHQPKVSNPNTMAQVNQRSRMKLMSQLSAAFSSVIVIPRVGLQSSRNLFSKKNFGNIIALDGESVVFLEKMQLTNGNASLPRVGMERLDGSKLGLYLQSSAVGQVDRVVYNVFARSEEGDIMVINSQVVETAGENGDFPVVVDDYTADLFVYAYGMKDTNARAKAKYDNYKVESGQDVAKLLMSRNLLASDYQLTETQGNSISVDQATTVDVPENSVLLRFYFKGDGAIRNNSAAGAVVTSPLTKTRGSRIKWYAVPAPGYTFKNWQIVTNGNTTYTQNPIEFTVWEDTEIIVNCYGNNILNGGTIGGME